MAKTYKFLIGGEWRASDEKRYIVNPYNGSAVGVLSMAHEEEIDEAIKNSTEVFPELKKLSAYDRARILHHIADGIDHRREEFAMMITNEAGKPIRFSYAEVDRAVATFRIAAEEATRIDGEVIALDVTSAVKGRKGIVTRFPVGPVACIAPFNFPLNLIAHKIAPAIACGNPAIIKPSPQAPLTAILLGEVLLDSDLPKKAINILPCDNIIAELLVTDDRVAMISFTGSAKVGWELKQKAGKKKVTLELGGNAAVIIDKLTDIPHAIDRCILGAFAYAGQVCIKVQRIIVHKSIYKQFELRFLEATSEVKVGNPLDNATMIGPMISLSEAERVEKWIQEAEIEGASILWGGKRKGSMMQPTVLSSVDPLMKVWSEEIFGPVVTLSKVDSIEDAIDDVNNSKYGLQAGIFSNDMKTIMRAYEKLDVGGLIVNDYPTFRVDNMPYGGVKDSGLGREGVRYAIREMTEPKLLVMEM